MRLLSQLDDTPVPVSTRTFPDRLAGWLGWTDAISLAGALGQRPDPSAAPRPALKTAAAAEAELGRVRRALAAAAEAEFRLAPAAGRRAAVTPLAEPSDFAPWRRRYAARQKVMEVAVAALRAGVREALAAGSADQARLAAVDEVLEKIVGEQEQALLSVVPGRLERRFEKLAREAGEAGPSAGQETREAGRQREAREPRPAWLLRFLDEARAVALAELDLRLKPVEGLVRALHETPARRADEP